MLFAGPPPLKPTQLALAGAASSGTEESYLDGDLIRFSSSEARERAVQQIVDRGQLTVAAKTLPSSLQSFRFRVDLPDTTSVTLMGRITSLRGLSALIEVKEGRGEMARAWAAVRQKKPRTERRNKGRRQTTFRVRLGQEDCMTIDLSPSGLCIACDQVFELGTTVKGKILGPAGDPVLFEGEVRWCKMKGAGERSGSVGIRLMSASDGYQALLSTNDSAPRLAPLPPPSPPSLRKLPEMPPPTPTGTAVVRTTRGANERRRRPRVRRRLKVTIGSATGFLVDLSQDGICVEMVKALTPGTEIAGVIQAEAQAIAFSGQVRWARAGNPHLGMLGRIGIRLRTVPPSLLSLLPQV